MNNILRYNAERAEEKAFDAECERISKLHAFGFRHVLIHVLCVLVPFAVIGIIGYVLETGAMLVFLGCPGWMILDRIHMNYLKRTKPSEWAEYNRADENARVATMTAIERRERYEFDM